MLNGRQRVLAGLAVTAVIGMTFAPSPAQAEPDIDDVQAQVDELYHAAEQASERRNQAADDLEQLQSELAILQSDEETQSAGFEVIRDQVADSIVAQAQGGATNPTAEAVFSDDTAEFLAQLSTAASYGDIQGDLVSSYTTQLAALQIRRDATQERVDEIAEIEAQAEADSAEIDARLAEAQDLLASLEAEEREQLAAQEGSDDSTTSTSEGSSSDSEETTVNVSVSGSAGAAVQYALAQVGDSYVYGATGPNSFDCSGLTGAAWAAAGVSLPRSSKAQYSGGGTKISKSQLQPGDLVFYYSPISHVAMYIGDGQIVHAANPRSGVTTASVNSMPYSGAVRPG